MSAFPLKTYCVKLEFFISVPTDSKGDAIEPEDIRGAVQNALRKLSADHGVGVGTIASTISRPGELS